MSNIERITTDERLAGLLKARAKHIRSHSLYTGQDEAQWTAYSTIADVLDDLASDIEGDQLRTE